MLKQALEQGQTDALKKMGVAPGFMQKLVGTAVRNPNAMLAGVGALGGALAGGEDNRLEGALMGAGLGYGAGRLGAGNLLRKGVVGKSQWLGEDAANFARNAARSRIGF